MFFLILECRNAAVVVNRKILGLIVMRRVGSRAVTVVRILPPFIYGVFLFYSPA